MFWKVAGKPFTIYIISTIIVSFLYGLTENFLILASIWLLLLVGLPFWTGRHVNWGHGYVNREIWSGHGLLSFFAGAYVGFVLHLMYDFLKSITIK